MKLPCEIQKIVGSKPYKTENIGKSGCDVLIFDDMVLKIGPAEGQPMKTQAELMKWLENKLSVPECLYYSVHEDKEYMLMSRMYGKMACDEDNMSDPYKLMDILADALKRLWTVDVSDCPVDMSLDYKLKMAEYNVENNLVDVENAQQGTFGKDGFENPEALLAWLKNNRPDEDIV
ncbi:MAG: phosphotransferase, partial [Clostridia bacterium]|nr:phosphotransferase [Clostridia bacterium]